MKTILALLIGLVSAGGDLMPTEPGSKWNLESVADGKKKKLTWTIRKLGDDRVTIVDWNDDPKSDLMGVRLVELKKDAKDTFAVHDGTRIVMILRNTGDEVRVFTPDFLDYYTIQWRLRTDDMKDGKKITQPRAYLSCGYALRHVAARVRSEKVTVPAGTFDAFRIGVGDGDNLWLVVGRGIVKWEKDGTTFELAK